MRFSVIKIGRRFRNVVKPCLFLVCSTTAVAQGNGNLQLHFINVGQADAAILISPKGETVMFDNGGRGKGMCERIVHYLQELGVTKIDYNIVTHYDDDHFGCTETLLQQYSVNVAAYDRGDTLTEPAFIRYQRATDDKRQTASIGQIIELDPDTDDPVTIKFVTMNADTGRGSYLTKNENDLSIVSVVSFGKFDVVIGGDISGYNKGGYKDMESYLSSTVGPVEVYKVNHHGSKFSSNDLWLRTIHPKIGVLTVGSNAKGDHPAKECLNRLHSKSLGIKIYWSDSTQNQIPDEINDFKAGDVVIDVPTGSPAGFMVCYGGTKVDFYSMWE